VQSSTFLLRPLEGRDPNIPPPRLTSYGTIRTGRVPPLPRHRPSRLLAGIVLGLANLFLGSDGRRVAAQCQYGLMISFFSFFSPVSKTSSNFLHGPPFATSSDSDISCLYIQLIWTITSFFCLSVLPPLPSTTSAPVKKAVLLLAEDFCSPICSRVPIPSPSFS